MSEEYHSSRLCKKREAPNIVPVHKMKYYITESYIMMSTKLRVRIGRPLKSE